MGSRPAANPRYLTSGQLASFLNGLYVLLIIEYSYVAVYREYTKYLIADKWSL
jgi:hypothetical protein